MKSLKTTLSLIFLGLCLAVALGIGLMLFFQYRSYIKRSYSDTITNTAVSIERLFPPLKDADWIIAEGQEGSSGYYDLVRQINDITDSYGFAYIYYLQYNRGNYNFIFDTDDFSLIGNSEIQKYLLKPYEDVPAEVTEAWTNRKLVITKEPYTDEYGTFVSGFYPVLNDSGSPVGVLGLDLDVTYVQNL